MNTTALAAGALVLLGLAAGARQALPSEDPEPVIRIKARRFEYEPREVTVKRGVPVVLELVSEDRTHGFKLHALGVRADVKPGQPARVRIVPQKAGRFSFQCDVFCGSGHEDMNGDLVVVD